MTYERLILWHNIIFLKFFSFNWIKTQHYESQDKGSNPLRAIKLLNERMAEWLKASVCKTEREKSFIAGSNPVTFLKYYGMVAE